MAKIGRIETQKEFTEIIGIGAQTLTKYKNTRNKPPGWQEPDIPGDWIIQWAIKTNSSIDELLKPYLKVERLKMTSEDEKPLVRGIEIAIPYAWKESGEMPDLERITMELGKFWIETYFRDKKASLVAWIMKSDNMSGPNKDSIDRNSLVLIDTRNNSIDGDGIYAFTTNGHIMIRRVLQRIDGSNDYQNDNPVYRIGSTKGENIMPGGVSVLGRVVFVGRVI